MSAFGPHHTLTQPSPARQRLVFVSSNKIAYSTQRNLQSSKAVHDELWRLIDNMKLKAELAIDPSYATGARCLDALIQDRRMASDSGTADTSRVTLAPDNKPVL
jgi:hypothetical protein